MKLQPSQPTRLAAYTDNTWVSPLAVLRITGPAEAAGLIVLRGSDGKAIYPERISEADLALVQRDFPRHTKAYQALLKRARQEGKPVVFELDDLLLELPGDHPDRLNHYYAPALLPVLEAISQADAVTVSSQPLADYLAPFNPHVHVLPNALDNRFWQLLPPRQPAKSGQPVVIGYMGGDSHTPDLAAIAPALLNTARRYGERVRFHFLGAPPPAGLAALPGLQWSPAETYDYARFAPAFQQLHFDVLLAPLRDNLFNRCKSSIKFLEYSACGVAGVYSDLDPYAAIVRQGQNGWLANGTDAWEEALARLIEDPDLRYRLAQQAQETLRSGWLLSQRAASWATFYNSVKPKKEPAPPLDPGSRVLRQAAGQLHTYQEDLSSRLIQDAAALAHVQPRLVQAEQERDSLKAQIEEIYHSRAWKVVQRAWHLRSRLRPRAVSGSESSPPAPAAGAFTPYAADPGCWQPLNEFLHPEPAPAAYDVIVLPVMDWDTRVQRPQQLAKQFASSGQRVFFLRTTFYEPQGAQAAPAVRQVEERIYEVQLPGPAKLNIYHERLGDQAQAGMLGAFERLKQAFDIHEAVCLVDLPFWTPLAMDLRRLHGWKMVYDCMDYHPGFSSNTPDMLSAEETLARESDLVLVTSHFLLSLMSLHNPRCRLVPNGADFDHFRFPSLQAPPEIEPLSKPIIGYYGAIADWFDTGLVGALAQARPEWSFVLIGDARYADLQPVQDLPNVHLLGEKPYAALPPYLHAFDTAIIPFVKTPLTEATNPVKLFEYLSAGRAVVATNLDELRYYEEHARLASTAEEWLAALDAARQDYTPEQVAARFDFARQNTWEARFQEVQAALGELYPKASVIVLTYNNLDYNRLCLESIVEKTVYPNYELVVVDNASQDGTPEFLTTFAAHHPHVRLILNTENTGFAHGNNQGAAVAQGEVLVFLNNDTVVTRGWLSGLVRRVADFQVGMVGPVTNWSGNETCIPVGYTSIKDMDAFARAYTAAHAGLANEIRMLPFLCVAMRRDVYEETGPLDEAFGIGMFEDDDYALRVRAQGYKIICAEDIFVHHWGRASFSKIDQVRYQRLFDENRRKFEEKWGITWEPHQGR